MSQYDCFIEGANTSNFPLTALPYGVFKTEKSSPRVGVAISNYVLDLSVLEEENLLPKAVIKIFNKSSLNAFANLGQKFSHEVRTTIQTLLSNNCPTLKKNAALLKKALFHQEQVEMLLPFEIKGFSDFYASIHHASNVGRLFRGKDNPLLPNWKYLPVAYNGRASTIYPSGTNITRPRGQIKMPDAEHPHFTTTQKLDFELEMGIYVGVGNPNGKPIPVNQAKNHVFGLCLLNDWSARDIQSFEYQPLGPFLSKSFATSVSHWVLPIEALEPFTCPHAKQSPEPVDYLRQEDPTQFDIKLKVELMPRGARYKKTLCETNYKELYWTMEQMLAHHTVNNCVLQTGDLFGSGTISGIDRSNWGSLLEITQNGVDPIILNNEKRTFLEDDDTVIMSGYCENDHHRISFGSLVGKIITN